MKKVALITVFTAMMVFFSGCEKYLDVKPRGFDVPHKLAHFQGLIMGSFTMNIGANYGTFEHEIDQAGFIFLTSIDGPRSRAFLWQPDIYHDDQNASEWNSITGSFYRINVVVNGVMDAEDGTYEERRTLQAEARMLRAFFTYRMAQHFGKPYNETTAHTDLAVPIIRTASTVAVDFDRHTVAEVYDFVIREMTESIPHLSKRRAHPGRVFYAAGNAILGKVYWMMGKYAEALPYLKTAKDEINNDPERGFLDISSFITTNRIIGYPVPSLNPENVYIVTEFPNLITVVALMFGRAERTIRRDVMEKYFTAEDYRLGFFSQTSGTLAPTAYADFQPAVYKYSTNTEQINAGVTVPELWLMYAESAAREGHLDEARTALEELRRNRMPVNQAAVPAGLTGDDLVRFAIAERFREHMGNGLNWYDMRRLWNDPLFQDLKQFYTRTDGTENTFTLTEARLTLRIPPSVMVWHPDYMQND